MTTKVTYSDYLKIKDTFSEDEIKEKYGRLIVIKEEEYKKYQIKLKRMK